MKYENRKKVEELLKEIDTHEKELDNLISSNQLTFSTSGDTKMAAYWIRDEPSTPHEIEVQKFHTSLKTMIQGMISTYKIELEAL